MKHKMLSDVFAHAINEHGIDAVQDLFDAVKSHHKDGVVTFSDCSPACNPGYICNTTSGNCVRNLPGNP